MFVKNHVGQKKKLASERQKLKTTRGFFYKIVSGVSISYVLLLSAISVALATDSYPNNLYWGDTHVHTYLSSDAYSTGTRITLDQAYRFAKGERVRASGGQYASLRRPLDFLMIADHAEDMGAFAALSEGEKVIRDKNKLAELVKNLVSLPTAKDIVNSKTEHEFVTLQNKLVYAKGLKQTKFNLDQSFRRKVWGHVVDEAERHYEPGKFTTFVGYEFSATNNGMTHRNILFLGSPDQTKSILPFSAYHSNDPNDLWDFMAQYKSETGGDVISIPHNSNLSRGQMFKNETFDGDRLSYSYIKTRAEFEPVIEITQYKGDSETHPLISPSDDYADYERGWYDSLIGSNNDSIATKKEIAKNSYVRSILKNGLRLESQFEINPFKVGLIGSTDTHTGLATAEEDNFWGGLAYEEPSPYRARGHTLNSGSAGYAAVWADRNTREAIFSAIKRKEVYATTGTRITLRFFAGWDFQASDLDQLNLIELAYKKGVPMGGDISRSQKRKPPSFIVTASKDPIEANLEKIQIIKGWQDKDGILQEKIFDVAVAPRIKKFLKTDEKNCSIVPFQAGSYSNRDGSESLQAFWQDPDFDADEYSFYYVRVLQIPTPRWTSYDAALFNKDYPANQLVSERAYSSPIWYSP